MDAVRVLVADQDSVDVTVLVRVDERLNERVFAKTNGDSCSRSKTAQTRTILKMVIAMAKSCERSAAELKEGGSNTFSSLQ